MTPYPDTCVHQSKGLCDDCYRAWQEDPESWTQYGDHPEGQRRYADLLAELDALRAAQDDLPPPPTDPDMPF